MKKTILILIISNCLLTNVLGQKGSNGDQWVKNSMYASFGGAGIFYSLNYERNLYSSDKFAVGARVGFGTSLSPVIFSSEFNMPIGINALYGKKNSHIELSFCTTNYLLEQYDYEFNDETKELKNLLVPSLCYRFQKKQGGLVIRAGLSALINLNSTTKTYSPWIDLGIGWAF